MYVMYPLFYSIIFHFISCTDWVLTLVASILATAFVAAVVVLAAVIAKRTLCSHSRVSKSSKQPSIVHPIEVIVHNGGCTPSQESKLLGSSGQESHVSTPTSVESNAPLLSYPVVLVVYSPSTPTEELRLIRFEFIPELRSYGFKVQSHDFACIKESPSQWLEREIATSTAVLCICNQEFRNDWEGTKSGSHSSLPLVESLKHLVHATVQQNECLSKYAIIFLKPGDVDRDYIPTKYLQGDPRQFLVSDVENIARFVHGIPSHSTSSSI